MWHRGVPQKRPFNEFACCSAAFGINDVCTAENRVLQRNFPKIAAQLLFSLVACCRGDVWRGGVKDLLIRFKGH